MEELVKKLDIDPGSVKIYKNLTEQEKVDILQRSWAYVMTSMKEGWGISIIEANACGTPSIAYKTLGLQDAILDKQTGLLVKREDIEELAKTIDKILSDTELRKKLANNATKWAKNFDWDKSSKKFLKIILKLCGI